MTELEAFAAHWRLLGQSEHTIECYGGVLRRFAAVTAIETATPLDLRAYLTERSLTVSAATIAVDVRALRAFYRWRSEMLECDDPSRTLKLPKIPEPVTESVSLEAYAKLMASIPTKGFFPCRDRAILSTLWSTGARLSEVARIEVEHLNLMAGTFTIPKSKTRRPRTVSLTPRRASRSGPTCGTAAVTARGCGSAAGTAGPEGVADDPAAIEGGGRPGVVAHVPPQRRRALVGRWREREPAGLPRRMGVAPDGPPLRAPATASAWRSRSTVGCSGEHDSPPAPTSTQPGCWCRTVSGLAKRWQLLDRLRPARRIAPAR